jgi:hypothetical protein
MEMSTTTMMIKMNIKPSSRFDNVNVNVTVLMRRVGPSTSTSTPCSIICLPGPDVYKLQGQLNAEMQQHWTGEQVFRARKSETGGVD